MTKIVDIGAVSEGDKSTLEKTGIATAEEPTKVEAKDLPEGTMMEITQPGTDKKFTFPALALAGGDYHKIIQASDGVISDDEVRRAYGTAMALHWQDGWYSTPEMRKEAKRPGYKHIHLGGSDTEDTDYEIEQDWVKSIWEQVDPEGVKLIRHYLNGHHSGQSGGIHLDGWTGDQYTIIVYLTPDWTPDDGGSIEFWTPNLTDEMRALSINTPYGFSGSPEMNIVKSFWPKAGRVVVFDARIPHVARAVEGDKFRVSLVFKARKLTESERTA